MKKRQLKKNWKKSSLIIILNKDGKAGKKPLMPTNRGTALRMVRKNKAKIIRTSKPTIKLVG